MSEQSVEKKPEEMEIDLIAIIHKIIAIRRKLYKAAFIGLVMGSVVGLSIPKKYKVNVTLSPEMGSEKGSNGLSGLAASFLGGGAGVGSDTDALNASLSSYIVSSTPFLLELLDMQVSIDREANTLSNYLKTETSPWWSYIIGLPGTVIGGVKSLFSDEEVLYGEKQQGGVIRLTKKEGILIAELRKNIMTTIDKKTAITSVSVTLQNPQVAAVVADSVVHRLQEHIIGYRTSKAKEDCAYLEKLFEERKQDYYAAQRKYAEYVDTHDNLVFQSVRAEQERLQNDMNLAYQVYSQVANQLQVARAKVQEEKPVFAVVEPAVIPLKTSGMGTVAYILLFVFVSILCTSSWLLLGTNLFNHLKTN